MTISKLTLISLRIRNQYHTLPTSKSYDTALFKPRVNKYLRAAMGPLGLSFVARYNNSLNEFLPLREQNKAMDKISKCNSLCI